MIFVHRTSAWTRVYILEWSLFGKLYGNRVKFVRFRWKTIHAKYLREKSMFAGCIWAVKFHGSFAFHLNSTSASMGTLTGFVQNCTKCTPVRTMKNPQASDQNSKRFRFDGLLNCKQSTTHTPVRAMKNPHASDQNSKRFRFYGLLNCKGHNPFLPSWITVFILKGGSP